MVVLRDSDQSPRPAELPSTSNVPDARDAPPDPAAAQSPGPSGLKGLERKTAPLALKRQVLPVRPSAAVIAVPAVAAVPDLAPRRSPTRVRATVPATRQGSPSRPRPSAPRCPPAVPVTACQRSPAYTRPPAPQRLPVPASSRAVQEVPSLAHRHPQVPLDSLRPSGETRDTHPRTVPDLALTRSPTRQRSSTSQPVAQEAPKLAHGHSRPPLGSPSRPRDPAHASAARPVPVTRGACHLGANGTLQLTPLRSHPTVRPPQQRTPVRPHPDERHVRPRSPARPARPQASISVLSDQRQRTILASRDHAPALMRPRPVLPDTLSGAPVISRPPGLHQDAARPRVRRLPFRFLRATRPRHLLRAPASAAARSRARFSCCALPLHRQRAIALSLSRSCVLACAPSHPRPL
ncbi:proteoglycan 4-like [Palaemon carinicauda]|uniref:proteoglycan 4-like n=1 Tax=Palaemon carinicauda TaxID=392227 RepID=UPI0035B5AA09